MSGACFRYGEAYQLNHFFISSTLGTSSYSLAFNENDPLRDYLVRVETYPETAFFPLGLALCPQRLDGRPGRS